MPKIGIGDGISPVRYSTFKQSRLSVVEHRFRIVTAMKLGATVLISLALSQAVASLPQSLERSPDAGPTRASAIAREALPSPSSEPELLAIAHGQKHDKRWGFLMPVVSFVGRQVATRVAPVIARVGVRIVAGVVGGFLGSQVVPGAVTAVPVTTTPAPLPPPSPPTTTTETATGSISQVPHPPEITTTTTTTTSSSAEPTCSLCVACVDDKTRESEPPAPEPLPVGPDIDGSELEKIVNELLASGEFPVNVPDQPEPTELVERSLVEDDDFKLLGALSNGTPLERRKSHELEKRAPRSITFCGNMEFYFPPYHSYTSANWEAGGSQTPAYPFFDYTMRTCPHWEWRMTQQAQPTVKRGNVDHYATEHVYEGQLVHKFMVWISEQADFQQFQASIKNKKNTGACQVFFIPFLWEAWTTGAGDVRIGQQLMNRLSNQDLAAEWAYLESDVNNMKAKVMMKADLWDDLMPIEDRLERLTRIALVFEYMRTPLIRGIYRTVSRRMRAIYHDLDQSLQGNIKDLKLRAFMKAMPTFSLEKKYIRWEKEHLIGIATKYREQRDRTVAAARAHATKLKNSQSAQDRHEGQILEDDIALRTGAQGQLRNGMFSLSTLYT